MAFKNLRAAARSVLNVINSIPLPVPFYPNWAALQAAQEANLAYQRKARAALQEAKTDFFDSDTRTFPNVPGFAEALRNGGVHGTFTRPHPDIEAAIERRNDDMRRAMQTPPDFIPASVHFTHRPGREVKEFHIEPGGMSIRGKTGVHIMKDVYVEFFETLRRTLGEDTGKSVLVDPAQERFIAYCAAVHGKKETVVLEYFVITSDASAAVRVAEMVRDNRIPSLYPNRASCVKNYLSYPLPMQGNYRAFRVTFDGTSSECTQLRGED